MNDPTQRRLWIFHRDGRLLRDLASDGPPGPAEACHDARPLHDMDLGEVFDMRCGGDGFVYILEGSRLRVRAIDFERDLITPVAGSGVRGYTGDGGNPLRATFGMKESNGPQAMCLDDEDNTFVADTANGAVRMIDRKRNRITTIAGGSTLTLVPDDQSERTDPLKLVFPSLFWLDWRNGALFISDRSGDLAVLSPE